MDVSFDEVARALEGLDAAFKDAPAQGGSIYDPPPDGDYQALIHEFTFVGWEAKNGNPAGIGLKVNYQVTNHATYTGRICGTMFGLAPDRLGYLKGWLETLGVDTSDLSLTELRPEPGSLLSQLLDTPVMIRVKRKDGYTNVYLTEKLGDASVSDVTSQQDFNGFQPAAQGFAPTGRNAAKGDDDIPF
jgi:hypothetical protein